MGEQVRGYLRDIGKDASSQIKLDDFVKIMTGKMGERNSREEINKIFALFDEDGTGKISFRNMKRISQEIAETLTDQELQEMIDEADCDGDGLISADEFYRVMRKKATTTWTATTTEGGYRSQCRFAG